MFTRLRQALSGLGRGDAPVADNAVSQTPFYPGTGAVEIRTSANFFGKAIAQRESSQFFAEWVDNYLYMNSASQQIELEPYEAFLCFAVGTNHTSSTQVTPKVQATTYDPLDSRFAPLQPTPDNLLGPMVMHDFVNGKLMAWSVPPDKRISFSGEAGKYVRLSGIYYRNPEKWVDPTTGQRSSKLLDTLEMRFNEQNNYYKRPILGTVEISNDGEWDDNEEKAFSISSDPNLALSSKQQLRIADRVCIGNEDPYLYNPKRITFELKIDNNQINPFGGKTNGFEGTYATPRPIECYPYPPRSDGQMLVRENWTLAGDTEQVVTYPIGEVVELWDDDTGAEVTTPAITYNGGDGAKITGMTDTRTYYLWYRVMHNEDADGAPLKHYRQQTVEPFSYQNNPIDILPSTNLKPYLKNRTGSKLTAIGDRTFDLVMFGDWWEGDFEPQA